MRRDLASVRSAKGATPLVVLTAYSAPMAALLDPHVDMLLVGDSLGMVVYGFGSTLPVTLEMMIAHGAAVVRGSQRAFVVVDMPYGSYENSQEKALENAQRILAETGAQAVKLEGGQAMAETVAHLVAHDVPVMGHVGLLPQIAGQTGDYKYRGRSEEEAQAILADAMAVANAGAFALVIEATAEPLARKITETVAIPTIGIGASTACDGQVLVIDDMLGMFEKNARFVKKYAALRDIISNAAGDYAGHVRSRRFPEAAHLYPPAKS